MADTITDMFLRHAVFLQRLTGGLGAEQIAMIDKNNPELRGELLQFLDDNEFYKLTKAQQNRIAVFRNKVFKLRGGSIIDASEKYQEDMLLLAEKEQLFIASGVVDLGGSSLALSSTAALTKMVERTPFLGSTLNQIYTKLSIDDTNRIMNATVDGIKGGLTRSEIEKSIFGTKKLGFKDGILQQTRNYINNTNTNSGVVRTTINGITNQARSDLYEANSDIVGTVILKATLDGRTSAVCRDRDGNVYRRGFEPPLPFHINERSYYEPRIDGFEDLESTRPTVSDTRTREEREKDFRADARDNGTTIKQERDKWKRKAIGKVPSNTNFKEWFDGESVAFQKEVLGATQYKLWKNGDMTFDRFYDPTGKNYTLAELYSLDQSAFKRAGLTKPN